MAEYDSDSSGDERNDVQTNVLLGFASTEPTSDEFSQLGGLPVWLDPSSTPSGVFAKCKICNGVMSLFLQLNADLPDRFPGHERRLYVLGCRRKACHRKEGCIRAFRAGRVNKVVSTGSQNPKSSEKSPVTRPEVQAANLGETLFGVKPTATGSINPFAVVSDANSNRSVSSTNPFASSKASDPSSVQVEAGLSSSDPLDALPTTFAEKARLSPPSGSTTSIAHQPARMPWEPWPSDPAPFPQYHLDADNEYLDPDSSMPDVPASARLESVSEGGGSAFDEKSAFESTLDKTFQRYADRLAQNPEQVLRYEIGGEPLLYSKTDTVGKLLSQSSAASGQSSKVRVVSDTGSGFNSKRIPRCQNCGAFRIFELQMTSHAIAELESDDMSLDGMDWGSIIVGTCTADCQDQDKNGMSYVEEWVGVQWEEAAEASRK